VWKFHRRYTSYCANVSIYLKLPNGAFDITTAAAKDIYRFDKKSYRYPSQDLIRSRSESINYKILDLERTNYAYLKQKGSKISLAGIGKGYAADKAKELLLDLEVTSGVIDASGDIAAWG